MRPTVIAAAVTAAGLNLPLGPPLGVVPPSAWAHAWAPSATQPSPRPSLPSPAVSAAPSAPPSAAPSAEASPETSPTPSAEVSSPDPSASPSRVGFTTADFERFSPGADAVTYDPKLVPVGAQATVLSTMRPDGRTTVMLTVRGLVPNRTYGAHVHQKHCGPKGDDAGPHYQKVADPVQPSVNPAYANPRNEIWLDFTTDRGGNASVSSTVGWQFTGARPGSVVVHAERTRTDPGHAGMAGARLGCVNIDF